MRIQFCVSALVAALVVAGAKVNAAEPAAPGKVRPAVYTAAPDAGAIQNIAWRRYAYRPYYGGYAYRPYAYRAYQPYVYGGNYAQPYYYGTYYRGYYPPNYGNYHGPGVRYGWRRGGAYYW